MADNQDLNAEQTPPPVVATDNNNATASDAPDLEQPEVSYNAAAALEAALTEKDKKAQEQPVPEAKLADATKAEDKPAEAKPAEAKTDAPTDTLNDEEVFKDADEISRDPHAKERTRRRIKETVAIAKRESALRAKEVSERDARIKELEEKVRLTPAATNELEALKKEAEQAKALAKEMEEKYLPYRRQYEVEKSPELEERFVKPVKAAEDVIASTLKAYGLGEATLAEIQKAGGLAPFSKSKKTYQVKDESGDPITITASQVVNDWLTRMDFADAEKVRSLVGEQEKLNLQRGLYIESERSKAREYFDGLSKKQQEEQAAFKAQQESSTKEVKEWIDTQFANDELLKDVDGDDKNTRAEARNRVIKLLSSQDRSELLSGVRDAAVMPVVLKQMAAKDALLIQRETRIKELEAEIDKVRGAGAAIPKQSGRMGSGTAGEAKKLNSDEDAIIRGTLTSAQIMERAMNPS